MKNMSGDIIMLHMCTKNYDHIMYGSWDMVLDERTDKRMVARIDRRMDGQKKWHMKVGTPPKNIVQWMFNVLLKVYCVTL